MKRAFTIFCLGLLTISSVICQTKARITDVDFLVEGGNIVVKYCIIDYQPGEVFFIKLTFITGDSKTIVPETLAGDAGPGITGGDNKLIVWDIGKDKLEITGTLKSVVTIVSSSFAKTDQPVEFQTKPKEKQLGGPGYAILSYFVPGLGGYFVDKNKTRSAIVSVAGVSAIVIMIKEASLKNEYEDLAGNTSNITEKENYYAKADKADAAFQAAAIAYAGIIIYDVVYVIIKGGKNKRARTAPNYNYSSNGLYMGYIPNGLRMGYRVNF